MDKESAVPPDEKRAHHRLSIVMRVDGERMMEVMLDDLLERVEEMRRLAEQRGPREAVALYEGDDDAPHHVTLSLRARVSHSPLHGKEGT